MSRLVKIVLKGGLEQQEPERSSHVSWSVAPHSQKDTDRAEAVTESRRAALAPPAIYEPLPLDYSI